MQRMVLKRGNRVQRFQFRVKYEIAVAPFYRFADFTRKKPGNTFQAFYGRAKHREYLIAVLVVDRVGKFPKQNVTNHCNHLFFVL